MAHRRGPGIEVERIGTVTVARVTRAELLDPEAVQAVGSCLLALAAERERPRLVLDLGAVIRLGSPMVGRLIALQRAVQAAEGLLAVCNLNPLVAAVFRLLGLDQLFGIYDTVQEALRHFP